MNIDCAEYQKLGVCDLLLLAPLQACLLSGGQHARLIHSHLKQWSEQPAVVVQHDVVQVVVATVSLGPSHVEHALDLLALLIVLGETLAWSALLHHTLKAIKARRMPPDRASDQGCAVQLKPPPVATSIGTQRRCAGLDLMSLEMCLVHACHADNGTEQVWAQAQPRHECGQRLGGWRQPAHELALGVTGQGLAPSTQKFCVLAAVHIDRLPLALKGPATDMRRRLITEGIPQERADARCKNQVLCIPLQGHIVQVVLAEDKLLKVQQAATRLYDLWLNGGVFLNTIGHQP